MELKNLISQNVVSGETVKTANAEKLTYSLKQKVNLLIGLKTASKNMVLLKIKTTSKQHAK